MEKNNYRGPQNYSPFLPAFGMAGGTKSSWLAGKHREPLISTVGTPDTGKPAHRIAAVQILLNNILHYLNECC
jgi:hypothetical protein